MTEKLTADRVRALLDYDESTGVLTWRSRSGKGARNDRAGMPAGAPHKDGYVAVQIGAKKYLAHRLIWLLTTGAWPFGEIDHKNRIRDDNRLANLRDTTKSVNQQNREDGNGIDFVKCTGKWRARVTANGKCIYLGSFVDIENAKNARAAGKERHHARV